MRDFMIRKATSADLPALGRLGAALVHVHYAFDPQRFMAPGDNAEAGYASFLGTQLRRRDVLVLVAERAGDVVGYAYAGIEPRNWKELRDEAGFIHDVLVAESERRSGIAQALLDGAIEWLKKAGAPRVVLWTATRNEAARRLFSRAGFRDTMVEMTREL
jgi:ribosomal protein S18 acetylase RimI-like enzyme